MSAAWALRAQAAAADELAGRFDAEARALPDLLESVSARMGPDVWRGPAADAFTSSLRGWRSALDGEAEALHGVARRLRVRADALRAEAQRIEAAEAAAAAEAAEEQRRLVAAGAGTPRMAPE
jgi:uncharacterized protein YukE